MSNRVTLKAQQRTAMGRNAVKKLKAAEAVPAIIYGSGAEPKPLQVSRRELDTILSHAVGENILVDLEINEDGKTSSRLALIQEVQHHPVNRAVLHVDFHAVSVNETLVAEIPVEPEGEAVGVKTYGGLLEQSLRSIEVECLPKDLPEVIRVDVSGLNIGGSLHVKDLPLPEGVTAVTDGDVTVFLVSEPKVSAETETTAEVTAPEVIREKKTDEGGDEAAKKE